MIRMEAHNMWSPNTSGSSVCSAEEGIREHNVLLVSS